MIPNAETLRKIQVEHGVTGSFKDRPLADWLQKYNPGEDEYEKVRSPRAEAVCLTVARGSVPTGPACAQLSQLSLAGGRVCSLRTYAFV